MFSSAAVIKIEIQQTATTLPSGVRQYLRPTASWEIIYTANIGKNWKFLN